MSAYPAISVVIPAFNEEACIGGFLDELTALPHEMEIIVVDDCSTDRTGEIARSKGVGVIRHKVNKGYGAALKTGFRAASNEYVLILDSDGQHRPDQVAKLLGALDGHDMVIGTRAKDVQFSGRRRLGMRLMKGFANYLSGRKIPDLNSGFRIIRKERVEEFMHILPNGFSFSSTITLALIKAGYDVAWQPVDVEPRGGGRSTVNWIHDGAATGMLILRTILLFNPLKVFVPAAGILMALSIVSIIINLIVVGFKFPMWGVVTALAAVNVFFIGLLADQISEMRRRGR